MERAVAEPGLIVLNGWAASPEAWALCRFMHDRAPDGSLPRLFSYVDQLDGLPESLFAGGGRFLLVGWSMGGSHALRLACSHPGQIAGLVLLAATPRMMEDRESGWKGMSPLRLQALRRGLELTHGQGFFGVPEGKPNPYMEDSPENLERGLAYLLATDLRSDLAGAFGSGCEFPVHIFQSAHDGIVRRENADCLKSVFPDASVTVLPGGDHALPIMIPDLIDDAVCMVKYAACPERGN